MRYTGLIVVIAAAAAAFGYSSLAGSSSTPPSSSSPASSSSPRPATSLAPSLAPRVSSNIRGSESIRPTRSHPGRPQGNPPLDVGRGRPPRPFAEADGADIFVNSGWRSPEYQQHLLDEAVARYGSKEEAARWVATPEASAHVSGDAVDIGPANAAAWLSEHGARYG